MSSRGKKKTTFAKLNREAKLRERRDEKRIRAVARREAAAAPDPDPLLSAEDPELSLEDPDEAPQAVPDAP